MAEGILKATVSLLPWYLVSHNVLFHIRLMVVCTQS